MSTLKIEHIANIANSGPDISIDTSGHLNIVNGSLQMGGTTMLDTSDATLKNVSKIGIGTASPQQLLHVNGGAADTTIQITNSVSGSAATDGFMLTVENPSGDVNIRNREATNMRFYTSNDEKMRIDSSGKVGIGTTSPNQKMHLYTGSGTTLYKAEVNANSTVGLEIKKTGSTTQSWQIADGITHNGALQFYDVTDTSVRMHIDGAGNIGISTTSPAGKLNVVSSAHNNGAIFDSTGTTQLWLRDTDATSNQRNWGFQISGGDFNIVRANDDRASGFVTPIYMQQAPSNSLVINSSGHVGFGHGSPSAPIDVVTDSNVYAAEFTQSNTSNGDGMLISVGSTASADYALTVRSNAGNTSVLAAKADGNVGIGTFTPNAKLHISRSDSTAFSASSNEWHNIVVSNENTSGTARTAGIAFELNGYHANAGTGIAAVKNGTASDYGADLAFITRPQSAVAEERMRIDSTGNVLFGCTAQPSGSIGGSGFMASNHGRRNLWLALTSTADNSLVIFANPNGIVGQIRVSGSSTTYNTTSDRRLKENIIPIQDATQKILAMNPVSYTWINDKTAPEQHGFIAQEMQSIVPEAVSGDADSEEMMGMDYGKITPVIVKSLQDALNEISNLKQRINELEKN